MYFIFPEKNNFKGSIIQPLQTLLNPQQYLSYNLILLKA